MKTVKEKRSKSNVKDRVAAYTELVGGDCGFFDSSLLLIQQLIPLGLMAVEEALQEEVSRMVGERHSREGSLKRWGSNPGSVFLGNQKLGSCRQIGEAGYHQGSEESGGDSLEIVRPLENGDVCGKIFWLMSANR